VVPEQAVIERQDGARVFVVEPGGTVREQNVSAVDVYQGLRVLESGLDAGEQVIVEGIQLVRPGQPVKTTAEPLEKYRKSATLDYNADRRFTSKISRVPGLPPPDADLKSNPKQAPPSARPAPAKKGD
jgi:hypothetical protein